MNAKRQKYKYVDDTNVNKEQMQANICIKYQVKKLFLSIMTLSYFYQIISSTLTVHLFFPPPNYSHIMSDL